MERDKRLVEQRYIVAITENRTREVGIAAFDEYESVLLLSQFSDSQTFIHSYTKLHIYDPVLIIVPEKSNLLTFISNKMHGATIETLHRNHFNETEGITELKSYAMNDSFAIIESEISTKYLALASAAALFKHFSNTMMAFAPNSLQVKFTGSVGTMLMDAETIKNLELVASVRSENNKKNSLFGVINKTKTAQGARMLIKNLVQPPADIKTTTLRHEAVEEIISKPGTSLFEISTLLGRFKDLSRLVSVLIRIGSNPKNVQQYQQSIVHVINLKENLEIIPNVAECLEPFSNELLKVIRKNLSDKSLDVILDDIKKVITEDTYWEKTILRMQQQICYAVKSNENDVLDVARKTFSETYNDIGALHMQYREIFEMPNMKLQYTAKKGFYFTTPVDKQRERSLPSQFIQVSTSKKTISFTTEELVSLSAKYKYSFGEVLTQSCQVVQNLLDRIRNQISVIHRLCESISTLDLLASAADYASTVPSVRPTITLDGPLVVRQGRHPMLEQLQNCTVTPNDMFISEKSNFQLITGPNMAGKSTYIRQAALLTIMAQIGYYVPAEFVSFRIVDRLMTHLGTSDSLETNSSTFMNEMKNINFILRNATDHSLIIVDELGRGTSPQDGASIAFAVAEFLMKTKAYIYFVTHFSELTVLPSMYPFAKAYQFMGNQNEDLVPLYVISEGSNDHSNYGIETAKKSGMPKDIIDHAIEFKERHKHLVGPDSVRVSTTTQLSRIETEIAEKIRNFKGSTLGKEEIRAYFIRLQQEYNNYLKTKQK